MSISLLIEVGGKEIQYHHYYLSLLVFIIINEQRCGHFSSNRDLRQGDPISLLLYIIALEVLSRGHNIMHDRYNSLKYICANNVCPFHTYLMLMMLSILMDKKCP